MSRNFDGASYLDAGNMADVNALSAFTISAWVYHTSGGDAYQCIFSHGCDGNWPYEAITLQINGYNSNEVRFGCGASGAQKTVGSGGVSNDGWRHVAGVWSGTEITAYTNGAAGSPDTFSGPLWTNNSATAIGVIIRRGLSYWIGKIAEVAIWDAALTGSQISGLAGGDNPQAVDATNLIHYWPILGTTSPEPNLIGATTLSLVTTLTQGDTHPTIDSYATTTDINAYAFELEGN